MADDRWDDFSLNWGPPPDPNARPPPGAYYGLESPLTLPITEDLDMGHHKLINLSPAAASGYAVTLQQLRAAETRIVALEAANVQLAALLPKATTGTISRNAHGFAIVHKGANCTPLALLIESPLLQNAFAQEPFVALANFVIFNARDSSLNNRPYRFHFAGPDCEPITQQDRNKSVTQLGS